MTPPPLLSNVKKNAQFVWCIVSWIGSPRYIVRIPMQNFERPTYIETSVIYLGYLIWLFWWKTIGKLFCMIFLTSLCTKKLELITFVMIIAEDVGWRQHVVHALLPIGSMNSLVHHVWDRPQNCRTWAVFDKNVAGPPSSSHLCQDKNIFWNRKLLGLDNIKGLDFFRS